MHYPSFQPQFEQNLGLCLQSKKKFNSKRLKRKYITQMVTNLNVIDLDIADMTKCLHRVRPDMKSRFFN